MKKTFVLALGILLSLGLFAQEYSHWSRLSLSVDAGLNRFDGDIAQNYGKSFIPTAFTKFTLGAGLEYTLTPIWNIGLDYHYLPLAADTRENGGTGYGFNTTMHNISVLASFNALKWFFPNTKTKWGLWGGFGYGYSMHKVDYKTDYHGQTINTRWGSFQDLNYENDKGRAQFVPIHFLLEYNLTRTFAMGMKVQYRGFFVDDLDGRFRPNANDAVEIAALQMRVKFGAKSKFHTRNDNMANFMGMVTQGDLVRLQEDIFRGLSPVDPTNKLDDLDGRLKKLEDYLDIDGPDSDGDGVPNSRDLEPDTPAGNQVDFWGRTIPKQAVPAVFDEAALIYFDFDKVNLDEEAHRAIRIAANKLTADPELLVEVRGFTDNMGTNNYNAQLSQRRADVVKNELVTRYNIDPDRIIANGKGKYNPEDEVVPYRLYRTTVFFYSK